MLNVRKLLFVTAGSMLAMAALAAQHRDASETGVILTGTVISASGEKIGGATVSARRSGQTITTSVFTDQQGRYYFPPMEDGSYSVRAQVAGWEKADRIVELNGAVQKQDLVLKPTKDFFSQLSGDQIVAALPEDTPAHRRMKAVFVEVCTECHSASTILNNRFDTQGWDAIVIAMSRITAMNVFNDKPSPVISHFQKDLVAYLTEMRGPGPSPMQAKLPPRPAGVAASPVVYEYDLPAEAGGGYVPNNGGDWSLGHPAASGGGFGIHDATVDFNGNLWFTYNDQQSVTRSFAKVDTRTGRVTDFKYPRPDGRAATTHGIFVGHDGMIWFNVNLRTPDVQGAEKLGRIDPRTDAFDVFTPPAGTKGMTIHVAEDGQGKIWGDTSTGAVTFNPKTGEWRGFSSVTQPGFTYGAAGDRDGNGWWTQFGLDIVGHADVKTGKVSEIKLPPRGKNCVDSYNPRLGSNWNIYRCAYGLTIIDKLMTSKFGKSGSPAVGVIKRWKWTASDQNFVANLIAGQHMDPTKAAEKWVKAHPGKVKVWQAHAPDTVLVNDACPELMRTLERNRFTVVPVRHRHRRLFGGGFHCFTLDTVRDGGPDDYLS